MEKLKQQENEAGGKHAVSCDEDRKSITSKLSDFEIKVRALQDSEHKLQKFGDLDKRVKILEEDAGSSDINIGSTEELEEKLEEVGSAIGELNKKIIAMEGKIKKLTPPLLASEPEVVAAPKAKPVKKKSIILEDSSKDEE